METLAERARRFALDAHGDQKYGDFPYSYHLGAVADLARPWGEVAEAVAWLHDVVEDTHVTSLDIFETFGDPVAACVWIVTDPGGSSRRVRKARLHERLAQIVENDSRGFTQYRPALVVKVADRLANLRACQTGSPKLLKMYRKEHEAFRGAIFVPGLCDRLWDEIEEIIVD